MSIEISSSSNVVPFQASSATKASEYEFNEYENGLVDQLSGRMSKLGKLWIALVVIQVIAGLYVARNSPAALFSAVIPALFTASFAASLLRASRSFKLITQTSGSDIAHLINGMGSLSTLYGSQVLYVGFTLVASIAGTIILIALG